ncbi:MAG: transporter substrate-binding domain-containing protein [bacterium]|nr:transporter substrate-binding domain-containing protein [bacterium]
MGTRWVRGVAVGLAAAALGACGLAIPSDPDGTLTALLERGTLRAGASPRTPWVEVAGEKEAPPSGSEVELVEAFADHLGVDVAWTVSGESELVEMLDLGQIDVVAGGLTANSPYAEAVALTRPYAESTTPEGEVRGHVLAVPVGENAMLSTLERFLDDRGQQ